jgi:hemerythrin
MSPWQPSLATGIEEIDDQHRGLFERIEALETAIAAGEPAGRLEELFDYLARYAAEHFAAEERWMRATGYPGLAEHRREHADFTRRLRALVPHWESEGDSKALLLALVGFLHFWVADHVLVSDRNVTTHARAPGTGNPVAANPE